MNQPFKVFGIFVTLRENEKKNLVRIMQRGISLQFHHSKEKQQQQQQIGIHLTPYEIAKLWNSLKKSRRRSYFGYSKNFHDIRY